MRRFAVGFLAILCGLLLILICRGGSKSLLLMTRYWMIQKIRGNWLGGRD
jgi:hypothetical protein